MFKMGQGASVREGECSCLAVWLSGCLCHAVVLGEEDSARCFAGLMHHIKAQVLVLVQGRTGQGWVAVEGKDESWAEKADQLPNQPGATPLLEPLALDGGHCPDSTRVGAQQCLDIPRQTLVTWD